MPEAARFEVLARGRPAGVDELRGQPFPRDRIGREHGRSWMHLHLHVGGDFEPAVRVLELDTRDRVAERIEFFMPAVGRWSDVDRMLEALLIGRWTRHQVQQLMGMHDIAAVEVGGLVADAIAGGAGHTARACEMRVWEEWWR